jgi:hypothetical protein
MGQSARVGPDGSHHWGCAADVPIWSDRFGRLIQFASVCCRCPNLCSRGHDSSGATQQIEPVCLGHPSPLSVWFMSLELPLDRRCLLVLVGRSLWMRGRMDPFAVRFRPKMRSHGASSQGPAVTSPWSSSTRLVILTL